MEDGAILLFLLNLRDDFERLLGRGDLLRDGDLKRASIDNLGRSSLLGDRYVLGMGPKRSSMDNFNLSPLGDDLDFRFRELNPGLRSLFGADTLIARAGDLDLTSLTDDLLW